MPRKMFGKPKGSIPWPLAILVVAALFAVAMFASPCNTTENIASNGDGDGDDNPMAMLDEIYDIQYERAEFAFFVDLDAHRVYTRSGDVTFPPPIIEPIEGERDGGYEGDWVPMNEKNIAYVGTDTILVESTDSGDRRVILIDGEGRRWSDKPSKKEWKLVVARGGDFVQEGRLEIYIPGDEDVPAWMASPCDDADKIAI